jgi:hypothetical protein
VKVYALDTQQAHGQQAQDNLWPPLGPYAQQLQPRPVGEVSGKGVPWGWLLLGAAVIGTAVYWDEIKDAVGGLGGDDEEDEMARSAFGLDSSDDPGWYVQLFRTQADLEDDRPYDREGPFDTRVEADATAAGLQEEWFTKVRKV